MEDKEKEVGGDGTGHGKLGNGRVDSDNRLGGGTKAVRESGSRGLDDITAVLTLSGSSRRLRGDKGIQDLRKSHGCCDTDDWCQGEHQTDHDTGKVRGQNSVDDNEDLLILELAEAHVNTGWEEPDEHVEIEEEGWPCGRLVLGDGCDNWNVDLGVAGIPKRVETSAPWGNCAGNGEEDKATECNDEDEEDESTKQGLELLAGDLCAHPLDECDNLEKTKDTCEKTLASTWRRSFT